MRFNSKTYGENVNFKRKSQEFLFKNTVQPKVFVGLGGTHALEYKKYVTHFLQPKKIYLCDLNPNVQNVLHMDLLKAVKTYNPDFIDCDFCRTVITEGSIFKECIEHLKNHHIHWGISFTFSTRAHGLGVNKTIEWLNSNIFDTTLSHNEITRETRITFKNGKKSFPEYIIYYNATSKYNVKITQYCDTSNIISGIIWV